MRYIPILTNDAEAGQPSIDAVCRHHEACRRFAKTRRLDFIVDVLVVVAMALAILNVAFFFAS